MTLKALFRPLMLAMIMLLAATAASAQFVTSHGGKLWRGTQPYRYVGANFWYGAVLGAPGPQGDRERLGRELDVLHRMGLDNLRVLVGCDGQVGQYCKVGLTLQQAPGKYNDDALAGLDYLLSEMGKRGMVAVLYLNNSWDWSGGYTYYLDQAGLGPVKSADAHGYKAYTQWASQWASSQKAHELYYDYVRFILGRTNRYTGKPYTQDQAIMAWQVGNEPRAFSREALPQFTKWLRETTALIRSLDPNHLISLGSEGSAGCEGDLQAYEQICADPNVDYCNVHVWPYNWNWAKADSLGQNLRRTCQNTTNYINDHLAVSERLGKPLVVEEFGYPRDDFSFSLKSLTRCRDSYYRFVFTLVQANAQQGGNLAGCNFWGWGGEALPLHERWQLGDPYTCDPPQEQQGLNSVFKTDKTTLEIIKNYSKSIAKIKK